MTSDADLLRARKCWRTLEPYHGFVYFAPEAAEEYATLGVEGRTGDFLSRSAEMARAADLADRARTGLVGRCVGRPPAAAHAALPVPDEDHLRLWWAITALREYRGDGHLVALVDAELSGLEALVEPDGTFTAAGTELRRQIEDRTDRVAAPAWSQLTDDEGAEIRDLVRPWSKAVFAGLRPG